MAAFSYLPLAAIRPADHLDGWEVNPAIAQFAIIRECDGSPADWPLCDSEADALAEVATFNRLDTDDGDDARDGGEAYWTARFAYGTAASL